MTSEVLYNSTTQLKVQISTIIPALLVPLLEVDVTALDNEYVLDIDYSARNIHESSNDSL